jgi:hypothetical protein
MPFYSNSPVVIGLGVSSTTATLGTNDGAVGQRVWRDGCEFMMVYNDCNSEISPGYGVTPQSGVSSAYSCTVSSVTSADILLGVTHVTMATAAYGWIVVKGVANVEMDGTSGTAASLDLLEPADNGTFVPVSNTTGNLGAAQVKALEAIVSSASGSAFINCY